jgi:tetratricopeptide (TPR) repeat protein
MLFWVVSSDDSQWEARLNRFSGLTGIAVAWAVCQLAVAQSVSIPMVQAVVDSCFQVADKVRTGQLELWQEIQPCVEALELELSERERVSVLTNMGLVQSYFGDFDAAQDSFDDALSFSNSYPDTYLNRANLFYLRRDFEAAVQDYNEALRLTPQSLDVLYLNRGMAYQNLGEFELAEADFRAALSVHPGWTLVAEKLQALELERNSRALDR